MECLHIVGGVPLRGTIAINGAKNGALPLMVLGLLTESPLVLENVPLVGDIFSMASLLKDLGTSIHRFGQRFVLQTEKLRSFRASYEFVRKMRASVVVLGALLGRCGKAEVSLPGGCSIGVRPIDYHLEGLQALGVTLDLYQGYIVAEAPSGRVPGGSYTFPGVSMTGTQNLLFAAVLAKGESCLRNVSREPEIKSLVDCLQKMGAVIEWQGESTLHIQGQQSLSDAHHTVIPDRLEIGSYMIAAAITQGDLVLEKVDLSLLPDVLSLLTEIGVVVQEVSKDCVRVYAKDRTHPFRLETSAFPGFPTDLQAPFMALACFAKGESLITENVWENRFMHVSELVRMGASIHVQGNSAWIKGQPSLRGAQVMATDLRASIGLVLAALAADGNTLIRRIYHLDRGYERLEERLASCGAQITRLTSEPRETELFEVAL